MAGALAVCYETPLRLARYHVFDIWAIPKGSLLVLWSPNTAIAGVGAPGAPFAGIAMSEKVANDGTTEITAALDGTWGLKASAAAITVGQQVVFSGVNEIKSYVSLSEEIGAVIGTALETTAGNEVIKVRLNV